MLVLERVDLYSTTGLVSSYDYDTDLPEELEVYFPGAAGMVEVISPVMGPRDYHEVTIYRGEENREVKVGKKGAISFILDPATYRPITPGFHTLERLDNEEAIVSLGARDYRINANDESRFKQTRNTLSGGYADYPRFLMSNTLRLVPVESRVIQRAAQGIIDLYGLGIEVDPTQTKAQDLFAKTTAQIFALGTRDKAILRQLGQSNDPIQLPEVISPQLKARLNFTTLPGGENILHLENRDWRNANSGGFFLVQDVSGTVTILLSNLNKAISTGDSEFNKYLTEADRLLDIYFKQLSQRESAGAIDAATMHEMREKLGNLSVRQARRTIKKGLQPGLTAKN